MPVICGKMSMSAESTVRTSISWCIFSWTYRLEMYYLTCLLSDWTKEPRIEIRKLPSTHIELSEGVH